MPSEKTDENTRRSIQIFVREPPGPRDSPPSVGGRSETAAFGRRPHVGSFLHANVTDRRLESIYVRHYERRLRHFKTWNHAVTLRSPARL